VVTAYTPAFGSLLLLGGRLADLLGRKVTFLAGFAGVSAIGGARTVGDACRSKPAGRPR
jgi:MFS family permease